MRRAFAVLPMVAFGFGCSSNVVTLTPPPTMLTTFVLTGGTGDNSSVCNPATPPVPDQPTPPADGMLVGRQDWRNTHSNTNGDQCQASSGSRWQGVATFDMTPVIAELNKGPVKVLTGNLVFTHASVRTPSTLNGVDICIQRLEIGSAAPPAGGLISIPVLGGLNFPASSAPSSGAIGLPSFVPMGGITMGPVTATVSPPAPKVTVDATTILLDWSNTKPSMLPIVFVAPSPTLAELGLATIPQTPIPVNRSNSSCITKVLRGTALTVKVGR